MVTAGDGECIRGVEINGGVVRRNGLIIVHMPTALDSIEERGDKSRLFDELKQCDPYLRRYSVSDFGDKKKNCWIFKDEETSENSGSQVANGLEAA